jgi:hypothetical protein
MNQNRIPLIQIGAEMRQEALAAPGQPSRRDLPHGLSLILIYRPPTRMRLSLVRVGVWPSALEVSTVKTHFGYIPDSARQERAERLDVSSPNGGYYIIRLLWDEGQQLQLLPADPADGENAPPEAYYRRNS